MRHPKVLAALAVLAMAGAAQASHMSQYAFNPVEHDDQGRSNEPDGARSGLYDAALADCTVDLDGDGRCTAADLAAWPRGQRAALGCTGDLGRLPSGLCGLRSIGFAPLGGAGVPPGLVGVPGAGGPCPLLAGQRTVRLLDVHQRVMSHLLPAAGYPAFELNRKLEDAGARAVERHLELGDGRDVLVGSVGMYAWYGLFRDKNCNGVIDHLGGREAEPANEFTWLSDDCIPYVGGPRVLHPDVCTVEPTRFLGWELPGNHHTNHGYFCAPELCYLPLFLPADAPGRLALCTLQGQGPGACDAEEAEAAGDPLLGAQGSNAPDWYFYDYTGTEGPNVRTYLAAQPHPMYHYDPSVVVTATVIGAVNAAPRGEGAYDLGQATMVDVDRLQSLSPLVENFVQDVVKAGARGTWLTVRARLAG